MAIKTANKYNADRLGALADLYEAREYIEDIRVWGRGDALIQDHAKSALFQLDTLQTYIQSMPYGITPKGHRARGNAKVSKASK